jgi:hypothetical protein
MLLIGAGFWVFGMPLHNEALTAQERKRYMDPIYYCATVVELEVGPSVLRKNDRRIPAATKI